MLKFRTIFKLVENSLSVWRLARSGLFDVSSYARFNPDVPGPRLRRFFHYVQHGRIEERRFRQSELSAWLLEPLVSGRIKAKTVRLIVSNQTGQAPSKQADDFKVLTNKLGLCADVLKFHSAYQAQEFEECELLLKQLPMHEAFGLYHRLAVRQARLSGLNRALDWGLETLDREPAQPFEFLAALADMAEALGRDTPRFNADLLKAALASRDHACRSLRLKLWLLRVPVLTENGLLRDELAANLPKTVRVALSKEPGLDLPALAGFGPLIEAAALNALSDDMMALFPVARNGAGITEWEPAMLNPGDRAVQLRLLHATHWLAAPQNTQSASFVNALKTLVCAALEEFDAVVPIQAGRVNDITQRRRSALPIISYHSFTTGLSKGAHFKESALPGFFSLDTNGFSGWAAWPTAAAAESASDAEVEGFFARLQQEIVSARRSKYAQPGRGALPEGPYVFLPLQVPDDAVARLARLTQKELVEAVTDRYHGSLMQIVIKPHPYDPSAATQTLLSEACARSSNVTISQANIHDLIAGAAYVITINSGVGVEALLQLKQVITAGASDYESVTHPVSCPKTLHSAITAIEAGDSLVQDSAIKRYLYAAFSRHAFTEANVPNSCRTLLARLADQEAPA